MTKRLFRPALRERIAMAMCGTDTFVMRPMWTDDTGRLRLPEDQSPAHRQHVCTCARDRRLPHYAVIQCANMLIKADAAMTVVSEVLQIDTSPVISRNTLRSKEYLVMPDDKNLRDKPDVSEPPPKSDTETFTEEDYWFLASEPLSREGF